MNVYVSPDSMQQIAFSDSKKSLRPNNLPPSRRAFGFVFPFVSFGRIGSNLRAVAIVHKTPYNANNGGRRFSSDSVAFRLAH